MLKHVDNFEFWTTTSRGTFTATPGGASVSGGKFIIPTGSIGGALVSNNITVQPTYIFNARVNFQNDLINNGHVYNLYDAGIGQTGLHLRPDAKLAFFRGSPEAGTTQIGLPSTIALILDTNITYYDVEGAITVGASGSIECRVNGGVQIGPTVANTQNTSNATADSLKIGNNTGSRTITSNWEHIIVMDGSGAAANNFIGPVDVVLLQPTGDGFYTAWSVTGAATRWQAVDDPDPDENTTYISANVVGTKNLFTHGNLPAGSTAVKAAAVWARARRDDGTTRAFKVLLRNATPTDNLGSVEHFCGDDYIWFFQEYALNPFTGVAWTVTLINQVEYGVQVTT